MHPYLNKFLAVCLLIFCCACSSGKEEQAGEELVLQDDLGREIKLERQPERVMAFASSMTEMLFAVCDTASIVGRTPQCDYPSEVYSKPVVNNYPVDLEQVMALKPDLIFTVEGITPLDVAARLEELGIPIYYQKYRSVEDILKGIEDIGRIMGREQQANHLADSLRQQVREIERRYSGQAQLQRVLTITWSDPIYVYGQNTILTDQLRILGALNAVQEVFDQPYPALTREYILKLNPDVLLGGSIERLEREFFSLYPELRKIAAYQNKRIYQPTGNLIERPSPRVVESIRELESFLYP
ncbi:ABC transporter substrate-binding protein [Pontibacter lucknowensis]|uniref:Iron complex transport system substrate-binding protein n=1 Tax=Pontibacter lucknowensis TaxID=1077936 RepID=A0A1N6SXH9_9BACT|nr:helical backbone metal receptor [Pontibacter lucknowensis]SIQ45828.1 iron complex transport system substrate-binding protein [Pontibacter lucknowensis]